MCEGIAVQKKLDMYGLRARPVMTLDEMRSTAKTNECPREALYEPDATGMIAVDDVSGQELDPSMMIRARRDEIKYFKEMGVYEKVDI